MAINNEELKKLRDNIKPHLPQLISNGLLILISELQPSTAEPELKLRYDILISGYISVAIYCDLATKAPKYIADEYFRLHGNGIVMTGANSETFYIAYSFTCSLKFREYLAEQ